MKITRLIADNLGPATVPAFVGTIRDRIIKDVTGTLDPYREEKRRSNEFALRLLPKIENLISIRDEGYERFKVACAASVAGNVLDFDVKGHDFDLDEKLRFFNDFTLDVDRAKEFYKFLERSHDVIFLADNAGEIAFDTLLVREIKKLGPRVTVVVKGKPVLNDAMLADAVEVGMDSAADSIIDSGTDTIGTIIKNSSSEFKECFRKADLVVAKGMGHYETLTELKTEKPAIHLLMAKCEPVARSIGVKKGCRCVFIRLSS